MPTELTLDRLLATIELAAGSATALLVIDDLHELAGTAAESALERFVDLRPGYLRVLLGSRRPPALNLSRLRVSSEVVELSTEDLRFRSWEVEQLFVEIYGQPLPPETAAALARRTGGWAAALQMFRLSTAKQSPAQRRQAVADLDGRSRLVRSYLARNVLAELPRERRWFLTRTCTMGVLTGSLCDELLETTGSADVLAELERDEVFTSSHDDGETFRYHQVLQSHLEAALLQELGRESTKRWYAKSGRLLESHGRTREALRAFCSAEDWASIARIVQDSGSDFATAAASWYAAVPAGALEHDPWLALSNARRLLRYGSMERAVRAFRDAERLLDEPAFTARCRAEGSLAAAWLPSSGAISHDGDHRRQHWTAELRAATRHSPGALADHLRAGATTGQCVAAGLGALLAGNLATSRNHLDDQLTSASPLERIASTLGIAVIDILEGQVQDPSAQLESIALTADVEEHPWLARMARGLLDAVLLIQGVTPWRPATGNGYLADCERDGDEWGAALQQLVSGAVDLLTGTGDTARLEDAAVRFHALDAPVLEAWAHSLTALSQAREARTASSDVAHLAETMARRTGVAGARAIAGLTLPRSAGGAPPRQVGTRPTAALIREYGFGLPSREPSSPDPESEAEEPYLAVACLGGFRLDVHGRALSLAGVRPRAQTLLKLLTLNIGRDVHRERLVDALWPDASLVAGTRSLQVAVSSLRRAFDGAGLPGCELIGRRGDSYRFMLPNGSSADVRDLEQLLGSASSARARGDLRSAVTDRRAALELYRGELLPEVGPAEWVVAERETLRLAVAAAAMELAIDHRALDEDDDALRSAMRSVQLNPYSDRAWRLLSDLYAASGDETAAARSREQHRQVLAELALPGSNVRRASSFARL